MISLGFFGSTSGDEKESKLWICWVLTRLLSVAT